jgi:hypothetical protein
MVGINKMRNKRQTNLSSTKAITSSPAEERMYYNIYSPRRSRKTEAQVKILMQAFDFGKLWKRSKLKELSSLTGLTRI